jgi:purine-cytosine permease-like protein
MSRCSGPMLSEHAKEIIKDVDNVRKKRINIDCLLQKYHEKPEKNFIQKYAETQIAIVGVIAYWAAAIVVIPSFILTIAIFFYPDIIKESKPLYDGLLVILFIVYIVAFYNLYKTYTVSPNSFEFFDEID